MSPWMRKNNYYIIQFLKYIKLFLGAGLTLLVAVVVVKVAFSEGNPTNGLGLINMG
jgi:hypothetical protein